MQAFVNAEDKYRNRRLDILGSLPIQDVDERDGPYSHRTHRIRHLIRYNKELEKQADLIRLNEAFFELKLEELEGILSNCDGIESITLERLTELTLLCAGNYANNGCIAAVGDLIFNPRLILVHIKGEPCPVKKERYTPLTVQFKSKGGSRGSVIEWLKYNTMLETVKEPILPHLVNLLEKKGCSEAYLESVKERMSMIVTLTSRLSVSRIPKNMNIKEWISSFSRADRILIEKLFCRFDKTVFNDLGDEIRRIYA